MANWQANHFMNAPPRFSVPHGSSYDPYGYGNAEFGVESYPRNLDSNPSASFGYYGQPQGATDGSRRLTVDARPDGFDDLRRAMDPSPPPTSSGENRAGGSSAKSSSKLSKLGSFLVGVKPFKSTLQRPFTQCRESVLQELNELGVTWSEPYGTGQIYCEHGAPGSADYVDFKVKWTINGAHSAPLPGADMWYTKIEVSKISGNGHEFRRLGKPVLNAARYQKRGGTYLDYEITTWGLY